jgi:phospho-N-acetylmuramoyl-pentapeptide-transferase
MFYEWIYPLHKLDGFSALNVFRYITFRSAYAAITALLLCFVLGPPLIAWLRRVKLGQKVREEGPQSHLVKAGTPTMGGLLIVAAIVVPCLLWGNLHSRSLWIALGATVWLGAIGFLDDYLRVVKGLRKGLLGRYKLVGQVALGLAIAIALMAWPEPGGLPPTSTQVPFFKFRWFDFGWLFVPFVVLVVTGSSNAVNLTDGLDGLAIGSALVAAATFALLAYVAGNAVAANYLGIINVKGSGELTVFCGGLVGASLGFLWYNCNPAEVFMGDVGSMALGGAIGTVAVLTKQEVLLVLVGGLFVLEAMSVIIQVASFRLTGRRVFRMAPLHHHFELMGWAEPKVIIRFWILAILFALMSLSTLKLR